MPRDPEAQALREAERKMDSIYAEAKLLPVADDAEDDWNPSPPRLRPDHDWDQTLQQIERLQQNLDPSLTEMFQRIKGQPFHGSMRFLQDVGKFDPQFAGWLIGHGWRGSWGLDLYVHRSGNLGGLILHCCEAERFLVYPTTLQDLATGRKEQFIGEKPLLEVCELDEEWHTLADKIEQLVDKSE